MNTMKALCCVLMLLATCGRSFPDEEDQGREAGAEDDVDAQLGFTLEEISDKLVEIKHEWGTGNGFIAKMDGKIYLFTSQHILLGAQKASFTTFTGRPLRPRLVELAGNRDIARLLLAEEAQGFAITDDMPMGSPVGVFGKGAARTAAAGLYGSVTGVGADIVEVSADFLTENAGSPVLNARQEVIGIASYVRESDPHAMKEGTKFEDRTRRFCYRLTGIQWQSVNWRKYNDKFGTLYRQNTLFLDGIIDLFAQWKEAPMERLNTPEDTAREVAAWITSHHAMIRKYGGSDSDKRVFASEFSDSLKRLAGNCGSRANKIRAYQEQRGLNDFMYTELGGQAAALDYLAEVLDDISKRAQDFR